GSARVMGPCLSTGQAAGTAAALRSSDKQRNVRDMNTDALRSRRKEQGAIVDGTPSFDNLKSVMARHVENSHEIPPTRDRGRLAQRILNPLGAAAQAGVSTHELDMMARRYLEEAGATSPFLNYGGHNHPPFPGAICTSVNAAVVHGVPIKDPLKTGDIVSLDVGARLQGWIGDTAGTFPVGEISE